MIQKIDVKDASIAEEIRKQMSVATIEDKGLLGAGKHGMVSLGIISFQTFVLKFESKLFANLILSIGKYNAPSLVGIVMAESGGSSSVPMALDVKTICGTPYVLEAKSFQRSGVNYIQIKMKGTIEWGHLSFFSLYNQIKAISVDGSLEYNSSTDTDLINGTVG